MMLLIQEFYCSRCKSTQSLPIPQMFFPKPTGKIPMPKHKKAATVKLRPFGY